MLRTLIISGFLATFAGHQAFALAARELTPEELRENVDKGKTKSLATALAIVSRNVEGEAVDVRAFDADGICYRMLIMLPSGKLVSVIFDAVSGTFLAGDSPRGKQVSEAAKTSSSKSAVAVAKSAKASQKSNNGKSKDNSGNSSSAGGATRRPCTTTP